LVFGRLFHSTSYRRRRRLQLHGPQRESRAPAIMGMMIHKPIRPSTGEDSNINNRRPIMNSQLKRKITPGDKWPETEGVPFEENSKGSPHSLGSEEKSGGLSVKSGIELIGTVVGFVLSAQGQMVQPHTLSWQVSLVLRALPVSGQREARTIKS